MPLPALRGMKPKQRLVTVICPPATSRSSSQASPFENVLTYTLPVSTRMSRMMKMIPTVLLG